MISASENVKSAINSPMRHIKARVELYNSSTLLNTFRDTDKLISFDIERVGDEGKFFGFGVFQKINVKLIDVNRELNITTFDSLKVVYTIAGEDIVTNPIFYVTEVHRDENTNELSITAYDALYELSRLTIADTDLDKDTTYTLLQLYNKVGGALKVDAMSLGTGVADEYWTTASFVGYGSYEDTDPLKDILDDIAEVVQGIYYIDYQNMIKMARLPKDSLGASITKSDYIDLESSTNRRLVSIVSVTELGDNISVATEETGTTQYIRDNGLFAIREDLPSFLEDGLAYYGGFTINQFTCEWRGNPLVTVLDKLAITTKNDELVYSYLLNDTISYNGAYAQTTQWEYEDNDEESESNPSTIGEALKQTYARVDKANKEISLLVSDNSDNKAAIAQLKIDTEGIATTVSTTQKSIDDLSGDISTIQQEVATKISPSDVTIAITEALSNGIDSVTTSTGFTFNSDGLTVSKSDSEMKTLIDEDGMTVSKNDEDVLTADSAGVNAINLTAKQYLIIGTRSRFEDYGDSRTGCFWIGG